MLGCLFLFVVVMSEFMRMVIIVGGKWKCFRWESWSGFFVIFFVGMLLLLLFIGLDEVFVVVILILGGFDKGGGVCIEEVG